MPLYVFALVDAPPRRSPGRGLGAPLTLFRVPRAFALVERRADVPPLELGTLAAHHRVVTRVARMVPAILPVRFGTLLGASQLREILEEREEELAGGLEEVRDRVQFTWRNLQPAGVKTSRIEDHPGFAPGAATGTEYLRRLARRTAAGVPPQFRSVREAVAEFIVKERFEPASATRVQALYHLVARPRAAAYRRLAVALDVASHLTLSGPLPPFAFAPELL